MSGANDAQIQSEIQREIQREIQEIRANDVQIQSEIQREIREIQTDFSYDMNEDCGSTLKTLETLEKPYIPPKKRDFKKTFLRVLPFLYFLSGALACFLVVLLTHHKIGEPYKKNIVVKLKPEYSESRTLNCVSRKLCSGESFAVIDGYSIRLICDETSNTVTMEDMTGCIGEDGDETNENTTESPLGDT